MFCRISRKACYFSSLLPLSLNSSNPDEVKESKTLERIRELRGNETGWDRLYMMYSVDEFGGISPQITNTIHAGTFGMFVGACYGGFISSRFAYMNFMESNEATTFKSHLDAKKKLQNEVTVGFAKGAWRWGWRLGLFSSTYVLISTTIGVYRGQSSMVEYVAAGGVTGALYKYNMGLRAMAVGGGLGSVLGGIAGIATLVLLRVTGMTVEDIYYWQQKVRKERDQYFSKGFQLIEPDPLLQKHDKQLEESKNNVEPLETRPAQ